MGGTNEGYGIKRYKLQCIKYKSNEDILYSTEKYSRYLVTTFNGVQSVEMLNHYAEMNHLKLI